MGKRGLVLLLKFIILSKNSSNKTYTTGNGWEYPGWPKGLKKIFEINDGYEDSYSLPKW